MSDPARSDPPDGHKRVRLHPEDEREVVEAIAATRERPEDLLTVTPEALSRWVETGEWPESPS